MAEAFEFSSTVLVSHDIMLSTLFDYFRFETCKNQCKHLHFQLKKRESVVIPCFLAYNMTNIYPLLCSPKTERKKSYVRQKKRKYAGGIRF